MEAHIKAMKQGELESEKEYLDELSSHISELESALFDKRFEYYETRVKVRKLEAELNDQ